MSASLLHQHHDPQAPLNWRHVLREDNVSIQGEVAANGASGAQRLPGSRGVGPGVGAGAVAGEPFPPGSSDRPFIASALGPGPLVKLGGSSREGAEPPGWGARGQDGQPPPSASPGQTSSLWLGHSGFLERS